MGGPARHFRLNKARPGRPILRRHQTASFATNGASIQKISVLANKISNESILLTFWQITLSWMSDELVVQLCIQRKEVFTKSSGTPEIWDNTEKFRFYLWPRPSTLLKIRSTDSLAWWYGLSLWIVTASCFSNLKRKNKLYILGYDFRLNMDFVLLGNAVYKTHRHSCKSNVRSIAKCQLKCLWGFLKRGVFLDCFLRRSQVSKPAGVWSGTGRVSRWKAVGGGSGQEWVEKRRNRLDLILEWGGLRRQRVQNTVLRLAWLKSQSPSSAPVTDSQHILSHNDFIFLTRPQGTRWRNLRHCRCFCCTCSSLNPHRFPLITEGTFSGESRRKAKQRTHPCHIELDRKWNPAIIVARTLTDFILIYSPIGLTFSLFNVPLNMFFASGSQCFHCNMNCWLYFLKAFSSCWRRRTGSLVSITI